MQGYQVIRQHANHCLLATIAAVTAVLAPAFAETPAIQRITNTAQLFQTLDADRDGLLRDAEIDPQHERLFRRLLNYADSNGDGALNAEEWSQGLNPPKVNRPLEKLPEPVSEEEKPSAIFARLDRNNNYEIDQNELPQALQPTWERFKKIADQNGNGAINRREFIRNYPRLSRQFFQETDPKRRSTLAMKQDTTEQPAKAVQAGDLLKRARRLDRNGDGPLSREEARGPLAKHFEKIDADGNGTLDEAELADAADEFTQRRNRARSGNKSQ